MEKQHVCPWWLGYFLLIPVRKFQHNPQKMFSPYVKEGMKVLDYGSAMGYFSIPLAKMVGQNGTVYCADIQERMLQKLQKRAEKAKVHDIVELLLIDKTFDPDNLINQIDFILLFAVVHEVPGKMGLFENLYKTLKPGGKIFFAEPKGHVSTDEFEESIQLAKMAGFSILDEKPMPKGLSVLLLK